MTRVPQSPKRPTTSSNLASSPGPGVSRDVYAQTIVAALAEIGRFDVANEKALPSDSVGKLTLKILAVQRLFRGGVGSGSMLPARQDLWRLQDALNAADHAGLKETAELFGHFVEAQDSHRMLALMTKSASSDPAASSLPIIQEVEAIAEHSPSQHAQALARNFLASNCAYSSDTLISLDSLSMATNFSPFASLKLSAPRFASTPAVRSVSSTSPGAVPQLQDTMRMVQGPTSTRKLKILPELMARMSVAEMRVPTGLKVRKLICAHGPTYWISNSLGTGSFGKFHRAIDKDGVAVGIKVVRMAEAQKLGLNPTTGRPYTHVTTSDALAEEVRFIKMLGGRVKLHDMVSLDGKVYLVMTNMAGSLETAMPLIPIMHKRGVVRSIMAQSAEQLAKFHAAGAVHADFKLANILLDHDGQVVPVDFGKTSELGANGFAEKPEMGTYPSPEMARGQPFGAPADAWALAALFMTAHHPRSSPYIQYYPQDSDRLSIAGSLISFRRSLIDPKTGHVQTSRIDPFDGGLGAIFGQLRAIDKQSTTFVLERLLDPNVTTRATLAEASAFFSGLVGTQPDMQARATQALVNAATAIADPAIGQALGDVRAWDLTRQQGEVLA